MALADLFCSLSSAVFVSAGSRAKPRRPQGGPNRLTSSARASFLVDDLWPQYAPTILVLSPGGGFALSISTSKGLAWSRWPIAMLIT